MPPTLGYWDFRGIGQPIRLLLAYLEVEYEDKQYVIGPAPEYSRDDWFNVKFTLGLPFPNLPYFIDDGVKITQSNAIMEHIGRKNILVGKTEEETSRCIMGTIVASELHAALFHIFWVPDLEKEKADYLSQLSDKVQAIDDFIGDRSWCSGDQLTIADFRVYDVLNTLRIWPASTGLSCAPPRLKAYMNRFEDLPRIKDYYNREDVRKLPMLPLPQNEDFIKTQ